MAGHNNQAEFAQLFSAESCSNSSRIRDFLRFSRSNSDDIIRQSLNRLDTNLQCDKYFKETIIPQWNARSSLIDYCSSYSAELRAKTENSASLTDPNTEYDLRKDPYALRDNTEKINQQFAECLNIDNWVNNENTVESIVREQTISTLNQKCYHKDWAATS